MPRLPWKPSSKKGYEIQEKRLAKKKDSRPQLNSGRTWSGRGDVKQNSPIGHMLIDAKDHSRSKSYRVTAEAWATLKSMAYKTPPGCQPMLQVDVGSHSLVIIEESLWDSICERLRD